MRTHKVFTSCSFANVGHRYIYHDGDTVPTPEDIASSEVTEAHLREALIRMHELLEMTEHEIVRLPLLIM